jgi:hypothetical protein
MSKQIKVEIRQENEWGSVKARVCKNEAQAMSFMCGCVHMALLNGYEVWW